MNVKIKSFKELLPCILLIIPNHVDLEENIVEAGQPMALSLYFLPETKLILSMRARYSKA